MAVMKGTYFRFIVIEVSEELDFIYYTELTNWLQNYSAHLNCDCTDILYNESNGMA